MKRWIVVFIALLWCMDCYEDTSVNLDAIFIHARNMSTTSGVALTLDNGVWIDPSTRYIEASSTSGISVDSTFYFFTEGGWFDWWAGRTADGTVFALGNIYINTSKWVLIEETDGVWSCTWSDTAWE